MEPLASSVRRCSPLVYTAAVFGPTCGLMIGRNDIEAATRCVPSAELRASPTRLAPSELFPLQVSSNRSSRPALADRSAKQLGRKLRAIHLTYVEFALQQQTS